MTVSFVKRDSSDDSYSDATGPLTIGGGGSPTGSAGGALDGTYPNPGLAAGVAGAGLSEASDVLSVNVDGSTIEIATDTLQLKDGGVTSAKIANGTIVDADVNSSAAIAYSKLALGTSIVQGDLALALLAGLTEGGGVWSSIVKANDDDRTGTTTPTADSEHSFTATSGKLYQIFYFPVYLNIGSSTPDIKFACGEDNTTRGGLSVLPGFNTGDTFTNVGAMGDNKTATVALGADTSIRGAVFVGFHRGNGGTYQILHSQNSSDGTNTTRVKAGSILAWRIIA